MLYRAMNLPTISITALAPNEKIKVKKKKNAATSTPGCISVTKLLREKRCSGITTAPVLINSSYVPEKSPKITE